jgi:aspartate racemase
MARRLAGAGAAALAMPCNTAHGFAGAIREAAPGLPFLDMVALTADRLAALAPSGRVGMLASPATRQLGLFDDALAVRGIAPVWPGDEAPLLDAIRRLKRDPADGRARAALAGAAQQLAAGGADLLCIACTEFSLIADALPRAPPAVDALDVLAAATRDFALAGAGAEAESAPG